MDTKLQQILLDISRDARIDNGDVDTATQLLLLAITKGLEVDRASIWMFADDNTQMQCHALVDQGKVQVATELRLHRTQFPTYFNALDQQRNIVAPDAHSHPQTAEFSEPYLTPLAIKAMLDTPVRHHGKMVGIICIEHRDIKHWTSDEVVFSGVMADIYSRALSAAERLRYQRELEILNTSLEQLISERTHELTQSLEQLQLTQHRLIEVEKMASLGRLVAGIAHEINTPLGVAVTANSHALSVLDKMAHDFASGTLTRMQFNDNNATLNSSIGMVGANLQRAVDLVNSFKQTASDPTSQPAEQIDLSLLIPKVVTSVQSMLLSCGVNVVLQLPASCLCYNYTSAVATIIRTTLENACQHAFNAEQTDKTITLHLTERNGHWHLTIADNGRGMTPQELERAFEPFYTSTRSGGSKGLGLTLVFNLVSRLLQGEISVYNDHGCTIALACPLRIALQPDHQTVA